MEIKWIQDADIKRKIAAHILSLLPSGSASQNLRLNTFAKARTCRLSPWWKPTRPSDSCPSSAPALPLPKSTPWASTRLITVVAADGCSWRPANNGADRRDFLTCRSRRWTAPIPIPTIGTPGVSTPPWDFSRWNVSLRFGASSPLACSWFNTSTYESRRMNQRD